MKKSLLLPRCFQRIGWVILIPTALLGVLMCIDGFNGLPRFLFPDAPCSETTTRVLNNIALSGILLGAVFVACSRERIEDEMIGGIRLGALLTALYINTLIVVAAALTVYNIEFLQVMVYNLFTLPIIFLAVFRYRLWRLRKELKNEE